MLLAPLRAMAGQAACADAANERLYTVYTLSNHSMLSYGLRHCIDSEHVPIRLASRVGTASPEEADGELNLSICPATGV